MQVITLHQYIDMRRHQLKMAIWNNEIGKTISVKKILKVIAK